MDEEKYGQYFAQSEKIDDLMTALVHAQSKISTIKKDSKNPHFKSSYASLESVWDAIRQPIVSADLVVNQIPLGNNMLMTQVSHKSGQWIRGIMKMEIQDALNPQKRGSAITYMKRYMLSAMLGLSEEDDDGNAISSKPVGKPFPTATKTSTPTTPTTPTTPNAAPPKKLGELVDRVRVLKVPSGAVSEYIKKAFNVSSSRELSEEQVEITMLHFEAENMEKTT